MRDDLVTSVEFVVGDDVTSIWVPRDHAVIHEKLDILSSKLGFPKPYLIDVTSEEQAANLIICTLPMVTTKSEVGMKLSDAWINVFGAIGHRQAVIRDNPCALRAWGDGVGPCGCPIDVELDTFSADYCYRDVVPGIFHHREV